MRTFLEFLTEAKYNAEVERNNASQSNLKSSKFDDWSVSVSNHAASQALLRNPTHTTDDWADLHSRALNHIKNNSINSGEHVFYSRQHRQGYVAEVNGKKKILRVITVLDRGASRALPNTGKQMFESVFLIDTNSSSV